MRTLAQQLFHQFNCNRRTHIVGIGLERQTPHSDPLFSQHPQRLADGLQETRFLLLVYALHFLEQIEWSSELVTDGDERRNVFWETGATISDSGIKKIAPDPMIHPDSVGDSFNIGAARFTNRRDRVDIRNFQRQK